MFILFSIELVTPADVWSCQAIRPPGLSVSPSTSGAADRLVLGDLRKQNLNRSAM